MGQLKKYLCDFSAVYLSGARTNMHGLDVPQLETFAAWTGHESRPKVIPMVVHVAPGYSQCYRFNDNQWTPRAFSSLALNFTEPGNAGNARLPVRNICGSHRPHTSSRMGSYYTESACMCIYIYIYIHVLSCILRVCMHVCLYCNGM